MYKKVLRNLSLANDMRDLSDNELKYIQDLLKINLEKLLSMSPSRVKSKVKTSQSGYMKLFKVIFS